VSAPAPRGLATYLAPAATFGVFTYVEGLVPPAWYPVAYLVKAIAVTVSLYVCRSTLADIVPSERWLVPSIFLGLIVFAGWVGIEEMIPYPHLGSREAYDPALADETISQPAFLAIRLYGLVLMVPVMEELLWRSFVLRYSTQPDFLALPIGTFSTFALVLTVAVSGLSHPEWVVGALANLAYCLWLRRTRALFTTVVAHATTNAALGAYVLATHAWKYW
jgi:CAAX prenyl protease-like protein